MNSFLNIRSIILVVTSLIVGGVAVFAYERFLGTGPQLEHLKVDLAKAQADLSSSNTKNTEEKEQCKSQANALSGQVEQLNANLKTLQEQLAATQNQASNPPAAENPMMKMAMAMAKSKSDAKLQMLVTKLHLTPDQITAVKAALDAESESAERMVGKMFAGGKVDAASMGDVKTFKSLDQTLNEILTPDQQVAYQQVQTEEKARNADTIATIQTNDLVTSLQLNATQRDQVYNALYDAHLQPPSTPSGGSVATDPAAVMANYNQNLEAALSKILTPDQMQLYHQRLQNQANLLKGFLPH